MPPAAPPLPIRASDWRIGVWRSFLRAHACVVAELEAELGAEAGLPLAWYDVLLQLAEAPNRRLRMAELAERVLLSRSGLTRLVDRLQAAGLVRREAVPTTRAALSPSLPTPGSNRLRTAAPVHLSGIQQRWLSHFSDDELVQLGELLGRIAPE